MRGLFVLTGCRALEWFRFGIHLLGLAIFLLAIRGGALSWGWVPEAQAAEQTPTAEQPSGINQAAIQEVESGQREVACAAWWGFDPQDATHALQSALQCKAKKVIVQKMPQPWIVDKIELFGDKEIVFESGVEVIAKRGAFRGKGDSLLTARNQKRLKLIGPGATLRMWRSDYDRPPYEKAEWRHVLSLHGCHDVLIEGLTLAESGGDGIYLGAGQGGEPNRNIVIRNVTCADNYRQGISVITAENLLMENVTLRGTRGTPPQAGIDFEPNRPEELLVNCVMRNCRIEDNASFAIHVYLGALNASSRPISIRIENCTTRGTNAGSLSIVNRNAPEEAVRGTIEVTDCKFEDVGQARIVIRSNPVGGLQVRFSRCTLADPAEHPKVPAPIVLASRSGEEQDIGQVMFEHVVIVDPTGRPPMRFENPAGVCLKEIGGEILVQKGAETIRHELSADWLAHHFPCDPIRQFPIVPVAHVQVWEKKFPSPKVQESKTPEGSESQRPKVQELPRHRLRGTARYLVFARQDETVAVEMAYEQVGRYAGKRLTVQVFGPGGDILRTLEVPFQKSASLEFRAPTTGVFQILARPESNTLRIVRSSHPLAIGGDKGVIHLLGTTGDYYFFVPPKRAFGISVAGEGPQEQFTVELSDLADRRLWEQRNCDSPRSTLLSPEETERVLRLRLSRPEEAVLEDVYLQFRGIAPILNFSPEFLLWTDMPVPK